MPQLTSAKDKNFIAIVAMELNMHDEASKLMTTVGIVTIPPALVTKIEQAAAREKMPSKKESFVQALRILRAP